jgi:predicted SnoaL-like aldol condensation-catalyzing enzyme
MFTVPLTRSKIDTFDIRMADLWDNFATDLCKHWPDLHTQIELIFEAGDMVTCYAVNSGTNVEFGRSAIWGEIDIFKVQNGKITEVWSMENTYGQLKQLGFEVREPTREMA